MGIACIQLSKRSAHHAIRVQAAYKGSDVQRNACKK